MRNLVQVLALFVLTTGAARAACEQPDCQNDGMYQTIAGYLRVKHVDVPCERRLELCVPEFKKTMPVQAVIQNCPAPLVVVLLGVGGVTDSPFSKLWPSWLAQAGYHVLYFDSTFRPSYTKLTERGPSGNIWAETEGVRDIIAAFLRQDELREKVTRLGIVGISYGGIQSLILGQMASEGRLPFEIDAIQAYSPPVDMEHTAALFDRWHNEYRWKHTVADMNRRVGGFNPDTQSCEELSQSIMCAAVATTFQQELVPVIVESDRLFETGLLPEGDDFTHDYVKQDTAATFGFQRYGYDLAFPYWRCKIGAEAVERLRTGARLCELIKHQPSYVRIFETENDPFSEPEDMAALKRCATDQVVFLPDGGHAGYIGDGATRTRLLSLFEKSGR